MAYVSSVDTVVVPAVTAKTFNIELTQDEANELFSILYSGVSGSRLKDIGLYDFSYDLRNNGAEQVRGYKNSLHDFDYM